MSLAQGAEDTVSLAPMEDGFDSPQFAGQFLDALDGEVPGPGASMEDEEAPAGQQGNGDCLTFADRDYAEAARWLDELRRADTGRLPFKEKGRV